MNKQFKYYLRISLIALDIIVLNFVFFISKVIVGNKIISVDFNSYVHIWGIFNIFWFILTLGTRSYSDSIIINFDFFIKRTVKVYIIWVISVLFYLFFLRMFEISRYFIFVMLSGFAFGLIFNRFLYLGIHYHFKSKDYLINKVLIIGYNETAKKLEAFFEEEGLTSKLLGYTEDPKNVYELTRYPILTSIKNTIAIAKEMEVQEIFSTITPEQNNFLYSMIEEAEKACIRFKVVPNFSVFINQPVHIDYIRDMPILSMRSEPLDDVGNRIKKRILDLAVSIFAVVFILSWLVPILGLLIYLESKGPIFFSQMRTGKNNKTFHCLKFRSMKMNKDSDLKQATKNDQRITRVGRFIRKTSLDEFPQFINVLKGEMSLVGPRPHMVKHTDDYSKIVDQFMIRQFLKPGITGWAQINGYRGEITDQTQLKMRVNNDLWYLENWNIWLDIRIIFLTVYKVFKGDEKAF
ncbi:MAG: Undecaprenyl-phosphate glucose phosphotransferase [Ferruginibacter sp.]|uniref:exopolysaccharide biosynthesis polyprenyl glycosylphosphotransferase n=1 Tax=Ferruginibacter sp. TaxID=1940288 RepID=UPI002659D8CD|nr:exopolysaccharide biosynthesis polyprenyl glycosylphosphotransferase [Ferruginibacter sp.]MDB5280388.1 Undecaprenyl-phosphate glucose phosphotransferase [Ferruginibacter sp.]